MPPSRSRYITACQQLLALGVVVVALAPATRVVSLDVVDLGPGKTPQRPTVDAPPAARLSAAEREAPRTRIPPERILRAVRAGLPQW